MLHKHATGTGTLDVSSSDAITTFCKRSYRCYPSSGDWQVFPLFLISLSITTRTYGWVVLGAVRRRRTAHCTCYAIMYCPKLWENPAFCNDKGLHF